MAYDAIVIGAGGMGSATLYHLARSGRSVLGLERFDVPNALGSSHGSTRIFRMAYSEGAAYVPLLRSALELWRELEAVSGRSLLHCKGGLDIGPERSWTIEGSRQSCMANGLAFEELDASDVSRRFPGYRLHEGMGAIFQPEGGYLLSEFAIRTHVDAAVDAGAECRAGERVLDWRSESGGVRVRTNEATYRAARLVISAGAWTGQLVPALQDWCRPERQVQLWTAPREPARFSPEKFPVFNMEVPEGRFYGIPTQGGEGFKIGKYHHLGQQVEDPDRMDRECGLEDEAILREAIDKYFPEAGGPALRMASCLFTNTPDSRFILDRLPGEKNVFVAAGFSGHGFKFCSVVGKIMAQFCLDEPPDWDLGLFRLDRAGLQPAADAGD